MRQKTIITTILLFVLFVIFFLVYMKFYLEERNHINTHVDIYETTCGTYQKGEVLVNKKILLVDIADTECKKDLGLSGRTSLDNSGMIFTFEKSGNYSFWMKDMNFSLDIIWINSNFKVIGIEKNISPKTYPESFGKKYLAMYVVEVPAGYSLKNNIKVGDTVIFSKK